MGGLTAAKTPIDAPPAAPRPLSPDDVQRLMDEARARSSPRRAPDPHSRVHVISIVALWAGLACVLAASVAAAYALGGIIAACVTLGAGVAAAIGLVGFGAHIHLFSPIGAAAGLRARAKAGTLAGADMLEAFGLAEKILDADSDARLVARRDGVVVYANAAYVALAKDAGVMGRVGLPPRIDRLFADQGAETAKLFRMCRAAKSAAPATEILMQTIGAGDAATRRRFEVSVRPIPDAPDHVSWRLRDLPIEEAEDDALAAAYADFPKPVFAVERSGQISWANSALREKLGLARGAPRHLNDFILGETTEALRAFLRVDSAPVAVRLRGPGGDQSAGQCAAFRRGGVGEGFICVALSVDEARAEEEPVTLSGDVHEAPFGVAIIEGDFGKDARIVEANKAFADVFGGGKKNAPLARALSAQTLEDISVEIRRKAGSGAPPRAIDAIIGAGASARAYAIYARPVRRRRGAYGVRRTLLYTIDVTERKRMEADQAQDQKLKAVGRLSASVAHDFNNVLQVVIGNCDRLTRRHPAGDPSYLDLVRMKQHAQRAANLTKQLLAVSRKQTLRQDVYSITEILRDFAHFLDSAVGDNVKFELDNGRGLPLVRLDKGEIESAIMNLAVNARDAMAPNGGTFTIRTRLVAEADMRALGLNGQPIVDHLLIEVSDTGPGVPAEIRDKIFDPFFTTKEPGKGTGLGLATVYGIIGQMEGVIVLAENDGKGATFRIYLPAWHGEATEPAIEAPSAPSGHDLTGAGRILVVEDEDAVRSFVVAALEDCGYEVTPVSDGEEALERLTEEPDGFDLVVSDVMMPIMDGPSFVRRARESAKFNGRVIFMSGYAESSAREQMNEIPDAGYIQKPFTMKGLAAKVKDALAPAPPS